ncbi:hypothetical protein K438DRAFT_1767227 [Mycena galopus ATCC 62051]|nr:hypothetical protein K438DRAFT_1767227 [Mycena galopus ATCC 62051]
MCNHHDQNKVAAPSTYLAPPLYTGDYTIQSDPLSAHHTRLEALLDSALATLTLIRDYTPISPVLTFRSAEVLRALCRHASVPPTPTRDTTTPAPVPSPSPSPTPSSTPATYAEATTRTASDPVVSATADEPTPTHPVATVTADKPTPSHPVATCLQVLVDIGGTGAILSVFRGVRFLLFYPSISSQLALNLCILLWWTTRTGWQKLIAEGNSAAEYVPHRFCKIGTILSKAAEARIPRNFVLASAYNSDGSEYVWITTASSDILTRHVAPPVNDPASPPSSPSSSPDGMNVDLRKADYPESMGPVLESEKVVKPSGKLKRKREVGVPGGKDAGLRRSTRRRKEP